MKDTLQLQVEQYLGAEMDPSEWDRAILKADEKVRRIISREGDSGGKRREIKYMALLVSEEARSGRLSGFSRDLMALSQYSGQKGVKKQPPVTRQKGRSTHTPIVS